MNTVTVDLKNHDVRGHKITHIYDFGNAILAAVIISIKFDLAIRNNTRHESVSKHELNNFLSTVANTLCSVCTWIWGSTWCVNVNRMMCVDGLRQQCIQTERYIHVYTPVLETHRIGSTWGGSMCIYIHVMYLLI